MSHCSTTHPTECSQATQHPTLAHDGHCEFEVVDFLIDDTCCPSCEYESNSRSDVGRHMLTQHCLNVDQRYCAERSSELTNINTHESRHFGERPHVCGLEVTVKSDPPEVVICDFSFNQKNDLNRHRKRHEKKGFFVAPSYFEKKRPSRIRQVDPKDRLPAFTSEDRPKVCPRFEIQPELLKKPLPPCFLPVTSGPQADASTSTTEAGPSRLVQRARRKKATAPFQPRPKNSKKNNRALRPAQPAFAPSSFASIHSTMDASPNDFMVPPPAPPDQGASTSTVSSSPHTSSFPIQRPRDASGYIPPIAHQETVPNVSLWDDRFFATTLTRDQNFIEYDSYTLNLDATIPAAPFSCTNVDTENGMFPSSSDFPSFMTNVPIVMNAQSREEMVTLPLSGPNLSSVASDFMSVPTSEETAYNASLSMDAQSPDSHLPLLDPDLVSTLTTFDPSLEPPPSEYIAAPAPEETVVDESLLNLQYLAATLTFPINSSILDPDLIRRIDELLEVYPFPSHHRSWYESMSASEFWEEVGLHIMQLVKQWNQQHGQQYGQQYVQQYEQYYY